MLLHSLLLVCWESLTWESLNWEFAHLLIEISCLFNSESSSWLLARGEISKAEKTIDRVNRMNGRKLDQNFINEFQAFQIGKKKKKHSFWHIFEDKTMTRNIAILSFT
uniref:Uncharacterized protein n=1 Tax=Romanomermis culicivorax TaxID=13658 RepID=A0A915KSE9_ROMCU